MNGKVPRPNNAICSRLVSVTFQCSESSYILFDAVVSVMYNNISYVTSLVRYAVFSTFRFRLFKILLDESKLKLEVSSEEYNSEYAEGYIISQDPLYSDNYNIKKRLSN